MLILKTKNIKNITEKTTNIHIFKFLNIMLFSKLNLINIVTISRKQRIFILKKLEGELYIQFEFAHFIFYIFKQSNICLFSRTLFF